MKGLGANQLTNAFGHLFFGGCQNGPLRFGGFMSDPETVTIRFAQNTIKGIVKFRRQIHFLLSLDGMGKGEKGSWDLREIRVQVPIEDRLCQQGACDFTERTGYPYKQGHPLAVAVETVY